MIHPELMRMLLARQPNITLERQLPPTIGQFQVVDPTENVGPQSYPQRSPGQTPGFDQMAPIGRNRNTPAPMPRPTQMPPLGPQQPMPLTKGMDDIAAPPFWSMPPQHDPSKVGMPSPQPPQMQMPQQQSISPQSNPQGYWDRLFADPNRTALLRFGLGAISGEGLGKAMDAGMNMRPKPADPFTLGAGQTRFDSRGMPIASVPGGQKPGSGPFTTVKNPYGFGGAAQQDQYGKLYNYQKPPRDGAGKEYQTIVNRMMELDKSGLSEGFEYKQLQKRLDKLSNVSPAATATASVVNKTGKKLGEKLAESVVEQHGAAEEARTGLLHLNDAEQLLDSGIVTGVGAEWLTGFGNLLQERLGIDMGSAIDNTNAFAATMGQQVGKIIKQFGSGTGLSDADREYAEKIVGGKITLTENAIRKLMRINRKAFNNVIKYHNKRAGEVGEWAKRNDIDLPYGISVDMSDYKPYKRKVKSIPVESATDADIDEALDEVLRERGMQ